MSSIGISFVDDHEAQENERLDAEEAARWDELHNRDPFASEYEVRLKEGFLARLREGAHGREK